ncbi:MAG: ABC transporter ATP-binding protein [Anaerolineae bacterium]
MLIRTHDLRKTYQRGTEKVEALRGVSLEIEEGEFVTVMGPSGCGKSTLLHLIGGIDRPTSGQVTVNGQDLGKASEEELTRFRREHVGFVFQFYNLLPTLSALENVELPLIALGFPRQGRRRMAQAVLEVVGLGDRLHHKPGELSGGEQQRVAIARAMVANPKIILADEPTGDLDSKSTAMVVGLMRELNENLGLTFLVVTHDPEVGAKGTRTIYLKDGYVVGDENRADREVGR